MDTTTNTQATGSMEQMMSDADIEKGLKQYAANKSVVEVLQAEKARRAKAKEQAERKAAWDGIRSSIYAKLGAPPEDVVGFIPAYVYRETEVEDQSQPKIKVTITDTPAVFAPDGITVATPAITHIEERYPKSKIMAWCPSLNVAAEKGAKTGKANASGTGTSKRSGTLEKRVGNTMTSLGHFDTASGAVKSLNLSEGKQSAVAFLASQGYTWTRDSN